MKRRSAVQSVDAEAVVIRLSLVRMGVRVDHGVVPYARVAGRKAAVVERNFWRSTTYEQR